MTKKRRGRPLGFKVSDTTRYKTSKSMLGRKRPKEVCDNISAGRKKAFEEKNVLSDELMSEYKDNPEALKWIQKNKKDINSMENVLSEKKINSSSIKFVDVETVDTLTPERLYEIREKAGWSRCTVCGEVGPCIDRGLCPSCKNDKLNDFEIK